MATLTGMVEWRRLKDAYHTNGIDHVLEHLGWWGAQGWYPGSGHHQFHQNYVDLYQAARWALPDGILRMFQGFRFELVGKLFYHVGDDLEGFEPSWIVPIPLEEHSASLARWQDAGWTVQADWFLDQEWFWNVTQHLWEQNQAPLCYWLAGAGNILRIREVVCDVSNPDYQDWVVGKAERALRSSAADALSVGIKQSAFQPPQGQRLDPIGYVDPRSGNLIRSGATGQLWTITDTGFTADGFAQGYADLTAKCAARGFRWGVQAIPHPGDKVWDFIDQETADLWIGQGQWRPI